MAIVNSMVVNVSWYCYQECFLRIILVNRYHVCGYVMSVYELVIRYCCLFLFGYSLFRFTIVVNVLFCFVWLYNIYYYWSQLFVCCVLLTVGALQSRRYDKYVCHWVLLSLTMTVVRYNVNFTKSMSLSSFVSNVDCGFVILLMSTFVIFQTVDCYFAFCSVCDWLIVLKGSIWSPSCL